MAENKKSFVLYSDLLKSIEHFTNEEKGILFNHLLKYVNDQNPILTDRLILTAWKPIELQLKRDLIKFEEVKTKRSDAGKRSAELRGLKNKEQNTTNLTSVEFVEQALTNPTVNVNVNDNVNDNVINNKKFIDICLISQQWLEIICMQKKISLEQVKTELLEFEKHLIISGEQKKYIEDFKNHFSNWLSKKPKKEAKQLKNLGI